MLWCGVVSLFPEMFSALINYGVTGRAVTNKQIHLDLLNPRAFSLPPHYRVDDKPYGGGPGMVMQVEPLQKAIQQAKANYKQFIQSGDQIQSNRFNPSQSIGTPKVIYLSPRGKQVTHSTLFQQARSLEPLIFIAGRYEGIDQRLIELEVDQEWSIGDYILTGGELPAMVILDALIRLVPGVLGDPTSCDLESFSDGLLEYPQYTRPEKYQGLSVPEVLLSGNHVKIKNWRDEQKMKQTSALRPDLLNNGAKQTANKN